MDNDYRAIRFITKEEIVKRQMRTRNRENELRNQNEALDILNGAQWREYAQKRNYHPRQYFENR